MKKITLIFVVLTAMLLGAYSCGTEITPEVPSTPGETTGNNTPKPDDDADEQADGATIIGKVSTPSGTPVANVAVSDGVKVVLTNAKGEYRIVSDKSREGVFISVPGNYTAEVYENIPKISQILTLPSEQTEIHNFTISPVDNSSATIIIQADQHLANRTEDISQFHSMVLPDINAFIDNEKAQGRPVYSISLGDSSWEQFWVSNSFDLINAVKCLQNIKCPIFHAIGNHDNNPLCLR